MPHIGADVKLNDPAFVHDSALLFGKVTVGKGASIWPYVVTRAEIHEIVIGERTNVQDHVMIHVGYTTPTIIGKDCSITHRVVLQGCEIGDRVLIGIGATIMDGAKIGSNSIVAGHSIVTEGSVFPENSIIAGSPAKLVKTVDNSAANLMNAQFYHLNAKNYADGIERLTPENVSALQTKN
ncbi:gamma carbonic anhydrase family protein [Roseovarius aestuarii]|uniref:Acyl-[acyl-carrier-protein]--UDP-N-acetylglucosamine O-acyltransferase n=1 Tax=Roseovarius aestuarii TaxID=475083 RepID=A0A1X7BYX7_9RHOB|nr:gamma carbonic anhydrase family protein [Roseovarius aestuarii]SMC14792.1 Acyl-[acyl-carrier-protein]--UDP-N-acetylglucosamine O-acyltransferase [Roseovarius aestuarii]